MDVSCAPQAWWRRVARLPGMPDAPVPTVLVAVPRPLLQAFDYLPPAGRDAASIQPGTRVRVPLGHGEVVGMVLGHGQAAAAALKPVAAVLDAQPLLHGELWTSLRWLARYLHAPPGEVFATALPTPLRQGEPLPDTTMHAWRLTEAGRTALPAMRSGRPQALAARLAAAAIDEATLDADSPGWRTAMRSLGQRELVERVPLETAPAPTLPIVPVQLNDEQRLAADAVIDAAGGFAALLLDGVTGSGKTEVYLAAIADCLARGRQALVLVPEIGLTPQMLARFRMRLGIEVDALHSGLSDGERARVWTRALRGQAQVVVGTRSAVFVPLPRAGLIVVDEEHDASYKQFDGIRYHARDVALVRARNLEVPVLLGSATPSLESLHNAHAGRHAHLRLSRRAGDAQPPVVRVLDVRKRPLQAGLSPQLLEAIDAALRDAGQVLVFRNRRGYAPVLLCHDCGWSAQCRRCDAAMTVHAGGRRLQCHHCGARAAVPQACPECASLALQPQGNGTERIEELLAARFAGFPVVRIDRGSTGRRDALQTHLARLGDAPGILIGTQMLAKGHDLPNLTLVAVVGIDEGLYSADFRSAEKLAQLLVQVAGRAGRAQRAGTVLLQTHHPGHPLLDTLLHGGYPAFAAAELEQRAAAGFPPFAHLALLRAEAKQADAPQQLLAAASALLADAGIALHGPLPAPMPRRAGFQRMQLLLASPDRTRLQRALDALMPRLHALSQARRARWSLDVDPVELY